MVKPGWSFFKLGTLNRPLPLDKASPNCDIGLCSSLPIAEVSPRLLNEAVWRSFLLYDWDSEVLTTKNSPGLGTNTSFYFPCIKSFVQVYLQ